jgi:hypothetical protein
MEVSWPTAVISFCMLLGVILGLQLDGLILHYHTQSKMDGNSDHTFSSAYAI